MASEEALVPATPSPYPFWMRALYAATLIRAVRDHRIGHLLPDWFALDEEPTPFTFMACCLVLDLEPVSTRQRLLTQPRLRLPLPTTGQPGKYHLELVG